MSLYLKVYSSVTFSISKQNCASITTVNFRPFLLLPKEILFLLSVISQSPYPD